MACTKRVKHVDEPTHSPEPTNTSGLPALPVDLLFELVSSVGSILPKQPFAPLFPSLEPTLGFHPDVMDIFRALSQTSHRLRQFFLPLAWQQIKIELPGSNAEIPAVLGAIKTGVIAPFVRSMAVEIPSSYVARLLPELLCALSHLSGPLTLTLLVLGDSCEAFSVPAYDMYQIPAVRRLNVRPSSVPLAQSCPNLRQLVVNDFPNPLHFLPMATSNRSIRSIMFRNYPSEIRDDAYSRLVDSLPPTLEELGLLSYSLFPWMEMPERDLVRLAQRPSMRSLHFETCIAIGHKAIRFLPQLVQNARVALCSNLKPGVDVEDVYVTVRVTQQWRPEATKFYECGEDGLVEVEQLKVVEYD